MKFIVFVLFEIALLSCAIKAQDSIDYTTYDYDIISFEGYIKETTSYIYKLSSCGEFANAGVLKFIVTASLQKELVGEEVLVVVGCNRNNKKVCKYKVSANKDTTRYDGYLFYNDYEKSSLPVYWLVDISEAEKCCKCPRRRQRK